MTNKSSQPISIRLDATLLKSVKKWLIQHPGFSMSSLTALALKKYVSNDQILEGIKTIEAPKEAVRKSLKKMMKKHKKTLHELR